MAILVWNVSLLPKENQDKAIQKICSDSSPSNDATDFATMLHYVNELFQGVKSPISSYLLLDFLILSTLFLTFLFLTSDFYSRDKTFSRPTFFIQNFFVYCT